MSRSKPVTAEQLKANFDKCLKDAVELGIWPPSDQGFDDYVDASLTAVAKDYPNPKGDLIARARKAFEGQLDGSNRARREAELDAWLAQHAG